MLLQKECPRKHEFKQEEFEEILKEIPDKLRYLDFHKLFKTILHKLVRGDKT